MHRNSLILALSLLVALTGCRPKDDTDTGADTDDTDVATASITLTAPVDGPTYGSVTLTYDVVGFVIDIEALANGDVTPVAGEGHVHVKLDGEYVDATSNLTYTLEGLTSGQHTISVVLAGNDHTETTISDSVTMTVFNPTVEILTPADATVLDASSATLGLSIGDFSMSGDIGGVPTVGEGHYHVLVDGGYFDYNTDPTRALATRLAAGAHSLSIELVNSDHSSLVPPVMDTINVDVAADAMGIWIDQTALPGDLNTASVMFPVSVTNFSLAPDDVGAANHSGDGHYHVYLDGVYQDYSAVESVTLHHVPAGPHVVEVRLAENDHTEIVNGAVDYARITVAEGRPDVRITSPAPNENLGSSFTVQVTPENFVLDPANVGSTNAVGTGHYHVYVDGIYNTFSAEASALVTGVELGEHVVSVALVNNDHTDLAQQVWSENVAVTVAE